jgi:Uma2 family endonuclease
MATELKTTAQPDLEDVGGHDYRLTQDQYWRAVEAGIIPGDEVELSDGFLTHRPGANDRESAAHYRLSLAQYQAMAERGILTKDDRIELLEGWLIAKMTKNPPHEIAKGLTQDQLTGLVPAGWFVAVEGPTDTIDSEPEPDLMVVRGARRDYSEASPGPSDVAIVVEVSHSSLASDRRDKKRIYARSSYPTFWLVNLVDRRIEVYTDPTGPVEQPDYLQRHDFGPDDLIPVVIEGREIGRLAVRDLLP